MIQTDLPILIQQMKTRARFIAQYPDGRCSLFKVRRKRGAAFECDIINGAHSATFDDEGYCIKYKMKIVYVRESPDCPYTINDYNEGLLRFQQDYKEATCPK